MAKLESCSPKALRLDNSIRDPNALHMTMLERVRRRACDFDLLHFHLDYYPFSLFFRQPTPFVTTLHGRLDLPEHQSVFATFSSVPLISISDDQRRPVPNAGWVRTIHHGLPEGATSAPPSAPRTRSRPDTTRRGPRRLRHPSAVRLMFIIQTTYGM